MVTGTKDGSLFESWNDRARQVRTGLAVGNDAIHRGTYQEVWVLFPRKLEDQRATNRDIA
jgi:hypothetical protein